MDWLSLVVEEPPLPQPLTRICRYRIVSVNEPHINVPLKTHLECILSRETFVTMSTREGFDRKVYPFMSLEIVISVEALWTLIAFERAFIVWCLRWCSVHLLHLCRVPTVETGNHARHATVWHADHCHLPIRAVHVRHDRTAHGGERVCGVWAHVVVGLLGRSWL